MHCGGRSAEITNLWFRARRSRVRLNRTGRRRHYTYYIRTQTINRVFSKSPRDRPLDNNPNVYILYTYIWRNTVNSFWKKKLSRFISILYVHTLYTIPLLTAVRRNLRWQLISEKKKKHIRLYPSRTVNSHKSFSFGQCEF